MDMKILINATPTEKRAALLENDRVVELVLEHPDSIRLVGNIYRGKVMSILPGIQSAFIDIGLGKAAFLHASDVDPSLLMDMNDIAEQHHGQPSFKRKKVPRIPIEKVLQVGQEILVQVIKEPIGTKGAKVATQLSLAGRFLVLIPDTDFIGVSKKSSDFNKRHKLKKLLAELKPKNVGFIVRTIGLKVSETEFVKEIKDLLDKWKTVQEEALAGSGVKLIWREMGITTSVIRDLFSEEVTAVVADQKSDYDEIIAYLQAVSPDLCNRVQLYTGNQPLFDAYNIEKDLERSLRRKVWLKCGGYILFDHAEALLAIDVNTGRNVGRRSQEETIFVTNMEAVLEICRQLRLRDIGGLIVIDFIDMRSAEHRHRIEHAITTELARDSTTTSLTGLSKFGLLEITRKRVRPELQELFTDECPACKGIGWVFSPATVTSRIGRGLRRALAQNMEKKLRLHVHPAVAEYLLENNANMLKKLQAEHGFELRLEKQDDLDQDEYEFFAPGGSQPLSL